jgi:uncharacterized membrane protein YphA (DoxX/SURF4 family)
MSWRTHFGLSVAPVLLRFALGAVFVYAGAGKLFYDMPLSGPGAARLVVLGLAEAPEAKPPDAPTDPTAADVSEAADPAPAPGPGDATAPPPGLEGPPVGPVDLPPPQNLGRVDPADGGTKPNVTVELPKESAAELEFDGEITVSRRLGLVLAMDGAAARGHWPAALATAPALDGLAWAAALTEFIGGWLVLLGLLTRIWSIGLAGTMVVAMWLTQIGPALAAEGGAFLGFLPPLEIADPARWTTAWQTLFYQLTLMCAAGALALLGAGALSLDGALFGGRHRPTKGAAGAHRPDTMPR